MSAQPAAKPTSQIIATDFIVTDAKGHRVTNLQASDFTVQDNGAPRKILAFQLPRVAQSPTAKPVPPDAIDIILDNVNTPDIRVAYIRQATEKFLRLEGSNLPSPVSIYLFNGKGAILVAGPSTDGNQLAAQLDATEASQRPFLKIEGFYNLTDRLQASLDTVGAFLAHQSSLPGHKLVLWIGRGWPLMMNTQTFADRKQELTFFNALTSLWSTSRHARVTFYALDPSRSPDERTVDWEDYVLYLKPVTNPLHTPVGSLSIQALSVNTGGLALPFSGETSLSGTIARTIRDANKSYFLAFASPIDPKPDQYHSLKITVDKPGLTVRCRAGFYSGQ
jgi:VWFA-related protein